MKHVLKIVNEDSNFLYVQEMDIESIDYLKNSKENILVDGTNYKINHVVIEPISTEVATYLYVDNLDG